MTIGRLGIESPASAETTYRKKLRAYAQDTFDRFADSIDADVSDLEEKMIAAMISYVLNIDSYNRRQIVKTFNDYFGDARAQVLIEEALKASVEAALDAARTANVALIKDISAEQRRKLVEAIADTASDIPLEKRVQNIVKGSKTRAKVIARDQTAKINSVLAEERHKAAGASRYIWRTVGDERVRPDHAAVDGDEYAYGESTGVDSGAQPGQDIQCRCIADPIIF